MIKSEPDGEKRLLNQKALLGLLDYTLLNPKATDEALINFVNLAARYPVAAVCVYAHHLPRMVELKCKKACVVNFPGGEQNDESVLAQINAICKTYQVDEIDYVFPWMVYLQGGESLALQQSRMAIETCHSNGKTIKVIVESGAFEDLSRLYALAKQLLEQGSDFLKTSSGHYAQGATFEAAKVILQAIVDTNRNCGIKISGGIIDVAQAQSYIDLAETLLGKAVNPHWFRIGSSRLLNALINKI